MRAVVIHFIIRVAAAAASQPQPHPHGTIPQDTGIWSRYSNILDGAGWLIARISHPFLPSSVTSSSSSRGIVRSFPARGRGPVEQVDDIDGRAVPVHIGASSDRGPAAAALRRTSSHYGEDDAPGVLAAPPAPRTLTSTSESATTTPIPQDFSMPKRGPQQGNLLYPYKANDTTTSYLTGSLRKMVPLDALPLSVAGRWVKDSKNQRVELRCTNWYGPHLEHGVVNGLNKQPLGLIAKVIVDAGFNCVRWERSYWEEEFSF